MGMLSEFKQFAMRGNVVDMAVGIVIGAAFGDIVKSLVEKIISPLTGYLTGGIDFKERATELAKPLIAGQPPLVVGWGAVLQATINFIIVAFALFLVVKAMNTLKKKEGATPASTPEDVLLLREIRDSLKRS
ncbi:MAG: large-conductance mechanosensitive channel protein MscL [Pirellulales bacterium]|nr:large-conductance mechanosensitive channel protein MscL [Pirellulales bacterium]